jgi:predicted permease
MWRCFRRRRDADLDEEIRVHLDMAARDRLEAGATTDEARAGARREFGNVALVKDAARAIWGWPTVERLFQDVQHGIRLLRRSPGFTTVALLCLSVGVGATTLVFSAINGLLLQSLPYAGAGRLVTIHTVNVKREVSAEGPVSWADVVSWRDGSNAFERLGVWNRGVADVLIPGGDPANVAAASVSPAVFSVMRMSIAHGRGFVDADQQFGNHYRVILSDALWRRSFGADPAIVGRSVTILIRPAPARPYEVVGVMSPGVSFPEDAELWLPLQVDADEAEQHGTRNIHGAIGRLAGGASIDDARTQVTEISRRLAAAFPKDQDGWEVRVGSLRDELVGSLKTPMLLFQGAAVLLLFIACANVANLLLARGATRLREMAVRGALGAGRGRLARQLLTESLVLAFAGGGLGVLLAWLGLRALPAMLPSDVPNYVSFSMDRFVLGFALLVSAATGLLFGLLPALRASGVAPRNVLHEGGREVTGGGVRTWARKSLIVLEIAVSLVLVIGAMLLFRSNAAIEDELGYERGGTIALHVPTPADRYEGAPREIFFETLAARVRTLPDVVSVARSGAGAPLATAGPLRRMSIQLSAGPDTPGGDDALTSLAYEVTPNYFEVMGVPIVRGRSFLPEDRPAAQEAPQMAVVVNETLARLLSPNPDPLGKQFVSRLPGAESSGSKTFTIVGIARNFRMERPPRPIAPAMFIYAPLGHNNTALIIRTRLASPEEIVPAVRTIVRELDPALRVAVVQPFQRQLERALWRERTHEQVLALFGGLALGLSVVGLYGVIAYTVARRTREFGVRLALGAARRQIFATVIRQGLALAALGVAIGIAAALGLTRLLAGLLYEIRPTDPITFAAAAILLGVLAALAGAIPALRATSVDPAITLRTE